MQAFQGSSHRWSFGKFIYKRSAKSLSCRASQKRSKSSRLEVFYKKFFLAILQSLQGNICAKICFLRKLKTSNKLFQKEDSGAGVSFNFAKLLRATIY